MMASGTTIGGELVFREGFEYEFSALQPMSDHIDPPALAAYESPLAKGIDSQPAGLLVDSWQVSADGTEWLLRIRPNVTFHSGAPCDAQAVLEALNAIRTVLAESGDDSYWNAVSDVTLADSETLRLALHHPSARVASLLWGPHTLIHNEAGRLEYGEDFGSTVVDGTGPYRVVSWSEERVAAERWDGYVRPSAPMFARPSAKMPDRIEWVAVLGESERLGMLEAGELDCIHAPPADQVARLADDPRYKTFRYSQPASMYLTLNWEHRDLGFDDLRVRQAFYLALDREEIVATALAGCGSPTWGPLPPNLEFYDSSIDARRDFDPRQAGSLLDAAGFAVGADGIRQRDEHRMSVPCVVQDDETFRRVSAIIARQLANIGVDLRFEFYKPFVEYYEACRHDPACTINKWLWQDPMDALIGFCASDKRPFLNWSNASSPPLDDAFDGWTRAETMDDLHTAASRAQHAFAKDLPYVPLLTPDDVWVWDSRFSGYDPRPGMLYPYYHTLHCSLTGR